MHWETDVDNSIIHNQVYQFFQKKTFDHFLGGGKHFESPWALKDDDMTLHFEQHSHGSRGSKMFGSTIQPSLMYQKETFQNVQWKNIPLA